MDEDQQRCSGCKQYKDLKDFMNEKEILLKTCSRCRDLDKKRTDIPEIKEKKAEYYKLNRPDEKYIAKKKAEDEAGYLAHKAKLKRESRARKKLRENL
jgi:hypothetical protein